MNTQQAIDAAADFRIAPATLADSRALPNLAALYFDHHCDAEFVSLFAREQIGRYPIRQPVLHTRVFNADFSRGGLLILHNITPANDAELVAWVGAGTTISKAFLHAMAHWIFEQCGLRR